VIAKAIPTKRAITPRFRFKDLPAPGPFSS
jgi:hypothetical protein